MLSFWERARKKHIRRLETESVSKMVHLNRKTRETVFLRKMKRKEGRQRINIGMNGIPEAALLECNTGKVEDNAGWLKYNWTIWNISWKEKRAREHEGDRNGTRSQREANMDQEDREVGLINYWQWKYWISSWNPGVICMACACICMSDTTIFLLRSYVYQMFSSKSSSVPHSSLTWEGPLFF